MLDPSEEAVERCRWVFETEYVNGELRSKPPRQGYLWKPTAMTTLPRPNIEVNTKTTQDEGASQPIHHVDVVISRDNKARSYAGAGSTQSGAIGDVVRKILDDGNTAEYLP